jgi:hypothetical protein
VASGGGDVLAYLKFFALLEQSGQRILLDGPCFSACTLVLSEIPRERICVAARAVLGFHAAQLLDTAVAGSTQHRWPLKCSLQPIRRASGAGSCSTAV